MIFSSEIEITMIAKIKVYRELQHNNSLETPQKNERKKTASEDTVLVRETGLEIDRNCQLAYSAMIFYSLDYL